MEVNITFAQKAITKGAVRYEETNKAGKFIAREKSKIGTLYIRKTAFGDEEIPGKITVTLAFDD